MERLGLESQRSRNCLFFQRKISNCFKFELLIITSLANISDCNLLRANQNYSDLFRYLYPSQCESFEPIRKTFCTSFDEKQAKMNRNSYDCLGLNFNPIVSPGCIQQIKILTNIMSFYYRSKQQEKNGFHFWYFEYEITFHLQCNFIKTLVREVISLSTNQISLRTNRRKYDVFYIRVSFYHRRYVVVSYLYSILMIKSFENVIILYFIIQSKN